jgi:hypothetical protein
MLPVLVQRALDAVDRRVADARALADFALAQAKGAIPQTLLTAAGDLIYASAAGVAARLAKSTDGFVLTLVSGLPAWVAAATGIPTAGVLDQSVLNTGPGAGGWGFPIPCGPFANRRWVRWYINLPTDVAFTSDGVALTSNAVAGGPGSATAGSLIDRPSLFINNTIGANTGNVTYIATQWTRPDFRPRVRFRFRSPSSLANKRFFVAFSEGGLEGVTPLAAGTAASAIKHVSLHYDAGVSANFLLQSGDGTNRGGTNTNLAVVADTEYFGDLDYSVAGTVTLRLYVGSPIAPSPSVTARTTQLPTGSTVLYAVIGDIALAAGTLPGFHRISFVWESN